MSETNLIEIKFSGGGIAPGRVRSKELAEVLESIEDMIASVIVRERPGTKKEDIVVGLTDISEGSIKLRFTSLLSTLVLPAFLTVSQAVATSNFDGLPSSSIKSLQKISAFTRRHSCIADFITVEDSKCLATLTTDIEIKALHTLTGETTIYGRVLRVGGKSPRVMFETLEGQTIYCDLNIDLAKKLGHKLYVTVALTGMAEWNQHDFTLESFKVQKIEPFEENQSANSLHLLSEKIGKYFSDITDVEKYVSQIRSGTV